MFSQTFLYETALIWGDWTFSERQRDGAAGSEGNCGGVVGDHAAETLHQEKEEVIELDIDVMLIEILIDWKLDTDWGRIDICHTVLLFAGSAFANVLFLWKIQPKEGHGNNVLISYIPL